MPSQAFNFSCGFWLIDFNSFLEDFLEEYVFRKKVEDSRDFSHIMIKVPLKAVSPRLVTMHRRVPMVCAVVLTKSIRFKHKRAKSDASDVKKKVARCPKGSSPENSLVSPTRVRDSMLHHVVVSCMR